MAELSDKRVRLDVLLVERELCDTRTRAQALIMAGQVVVEGQRVDKPGTRVRSDAQIEIRGVDHPYVSRGGVKLAGALAQFALRVPALTVEGRIALDVGASTGGFTDCLLQMGSARVHAVDVGRGQLAWKLQTDARVIVHDKLHVRELTLEQLGERVDLVVIDCSFISLTRVLPHIPALLEPSADVVALVKPQFEVGRERIGKGGIVRDEAAQLAALDAVAAAAIGLGFAERARCESSITGKGGNREFFLWLGLASDHARAPS